MTSDPSLVFKRGLVQTNPDGSKEFVGSFADGLRLVGPSEDLGFASAIYSRFSLFWRFDCLFLTESVLPDVPPSLVTSCGGLRIFAVSLQGGKSSPMARYHITVLAPLNDSGVGSGQFRRPLSSRSNKLLLRGQGVTDRNCIRSHLLHCQSVGDRGRIRAGQGRAVGRSDGDAQVPG